MGNFKLFGICFSLYMLLSLSWSVHAGGPDAKSGEEGCCGGLISINSSVQGLGRPGYKSMIVGGKIAKEGDWPWMVTLQKGDWHHCGGSLIAPQWVLTASHCVVDKSRNARSSSKYTVAVGPHRLSNITERIKVVKVILHPDYDDDTMVNDVALVKLERPLSNVEILAINGNTSLPKAGTDATVIGWGALSEDGEYPDVLRQVTLPVVSNSTANKPESYGGSITSQMLAAGLKNGGKDSCQGDSGGPLVIKQNGQWLQVGVVSWGHGCARPNNYGIYARLSSLKSWISDRIGNETDPKPKLPSIVVQPRNVTIIPGDDASFSVDATGTQPLKYQWMFNGSPVIGGDDSILVINNAGREDHVGNYAVTVSNPHGSVSSETAQLTLFKTIPLPEALDAAGLQWNTGGNANWSGQNSVVSDGGSGSAAQSGSIHHGEQSWFETTVQGPGLLSFHWKASSEHSWDYLAFQIGSSEKARISGDSSWQQMSHAIEEGRHSLRWIYKKDPYLSGGMDAAWVDRVSFIPGQVSESEPIATETFDTQQQTAKWSLYIGEETYIPDWVNGGDGHLKFALDETEVWVFADSLTTGGQLVGDYNAMGVKRIRTEVWLPDPDAISMMSFYFYSANDHHLHFYDLDQLPDTAGWHEITVPLDTNDWVWYDEAGSNFGPPSTGMLAEVVEVGLLVYPTFEGEPTEVGLDNFTLLGEAEVGVEKSLLTSAKQVYRPAETISVSFDNSDGKQNDWIGLYVKGAVAPTTPSILWFYTDGTQIGNTLVKTGSLAFADGLPEPGLYEARLYADDGYELLAKVEFEVRPAPTILPVKGSFAPGEPIRLTFTNPTATATDWIGLYKEGTEAPATPSILWLYTNGTKIGTTALSEGSIEFAEGLSNSGRYLMKFFASDGYGILAEAGFNVRKTDGVPSISVMRNANGSITVTYEGKLQSAPTINGPWKDASGTSPQTLSADNTSLFGRAIR